MHHPTSPRRRTSQPYLPTASPHRISPPHLPTVSRRRTCPLCPSSMDTPCIPRLTSAPPPESSSAFAYSSSLSPRNSRSRSGERGPSRMAVAAVEEGWDRKMVAACGGSGFSGARLVRPVDCSKHACAGFPTPEKKPPEMRNPPEDSSQVEAPAPAPTKLCSPPEDSPQVEAPLSAPAPLPPVSKPPPAPGVMQEEQRSKKRKSPYPNTIMFRSPLSRVMLSPRLGIQSASSPSRDCHQSSSIEYTRYSMELSSIISPFGHLLTRMIEERAEPESSASNSRPVLAPAWSPLSSREAPSNMSRTSSTCSPRAMQEGQRSKKRKSPYSNTIMFRSPLSKMMLSPRPGTPYGSSPRFRSSPSSRMVLSPRLWVRSPSSTQQASSSATISTNQRGLAEFDLNVPICNEYEEEVHLMNHVQLAEQVNARRKEVPKSTKKAVFDFLLAKSKNGELEGHETGEASAKFSVNIRTVQRIWRDGKHCLQQGVEVDFPSGKSKRGRKKKEVDLSKLRGLPITSRSTMEDVSKELGVSTRKLHYMKREGVIQRVSNSIKPLLTEVNKKERLKWCMSMLEDPRSAPSDPVFKCLFDFVFIDEKWFYITRKTQRYYKLPDEEQPTRTCKNKNYIKKIMILCAYARPRFDSQGNCIFDGKIGCFPFVTYEAAKRSSKNRSAGTVEMKPMDSIKTKESREFLIDKVLPAIRAKWPREDMSKPIYIQQDNAPSHVSPNDKVFCEAAKKDGFDIRLILQPPNSPDLNILDLGFFNAIQSIQYKAGAKTTEELVAAVHKAFDEYPPGKGNRIFLTLQGCMQEVIRVGGGNNYDVPHIRKRMLERQGRLSLQLSCDGALVDQAKAQLAE